MKAIKCPNCGTTDFDTAENGTVGFCIVGCGAMFKIEEGENGQEITIIGEIEPLVTYDVFPKEEWLGK